MRELSLVFVSFVEREKKIAGSQVTVKLLFVVMLGRIYPLQCVVRC